MKNPIRKVKGREVKLTPEQEAIIYLARMMQNPMHSDYKIKEDVLNILGLEFVPNPKKPRVKR